MVPIFYYARGTILLFLVVLLAHAHLVSFDYPMFIHNREEPLEFDGAATVEDFDYAIQLTGYYPGDPDKASDVGRVTNPKLIKLYDRSINQVYDFTTKFSNYSIYGDFAFLPASSDFLKENHIEDGLAFVLVPGNEVALMNTTCCLAILDFLKGNHLEDGLEVILVPASEVALNSTEYSSESVEFDTFKNDNLSVSKYSSKYNILNVSATGYRLTEGKEPQNSSHTIDLREHLPEYVGISASTGKVDKKHTLRFWSFSTSQANYEVDHEKKLWEGLAVGFVCLSLCLLAILIILLWKKNKGKEEEPNSETVSDQNMDEEFQMSAGPKKISYQELLDATNNFEETLKLGEGGFGGVYKGYFKDTNSVAAIKRISANSRQGIKQYSAEVKIISQLRHRNLVKLNGWCHKKNELILIYEYMPNGSLDFHLFHGGSILSWHLRYNIALGLASALFYLQEELEKCVIHRDIKSSNIMLDSNFNTKLGDFGLARLMDHEKESETTIVAGTRGYVAPEYMDTGKARKESDIFSFGVVLLEIACGKKAIHHQELKGEVSLVEWVWELYGLKNVIAAADPKLYGQFNAKEMECLLVVGLWCANPNNTSRPSIKKVIKVLNFESPLPILPQNMPFLGPLSSPINNGQFFSVPSFFTAKG
ncbi:unnamed protein product [Trifolium pratense]|uniref:Uncharacterized protein n=1 Tax=Trifolium pratense TaxID=57577 RepID=A0ACB0M9M6_TRIPR|nr:unnamed protein product [Trifolium pratense]